MAADGLAWDIFIRVEVIDDNKIMFSFRLTQTARTAVLCVEKQDLPQGALVKVIKNGSFLMFPEKMPSEKLMDA